MNINLSKEDLIRAFIEDCYKSDWVVDKTGEYLVGSVFQVNTGMIVSAYTVSFKGSYDLTFYIQVGCYYDYMEDQEFSGLYKAAQQALDYVLAEYKCRDLEEYVEYIDSLHEEALKENLVYNNIEELLV